MILMRLYLYFYHYVFVDTVNDFNDAWYANGGHGKKTVHDEKLLQSELELIKTRA